MIVEENVKGWSDKLPKYKKSKYPQPLDPNLPLHYNVSIYCGARGSGKTFLAVKYLYELEQRGIQDNVPLRIVLVSPTATSDSNKIFDVLQSLDPHDIIEDYTDQALQEKIAELRADMDESIEYKQYKKIFVKFLKSKSLNNLKDDEIILLEKYDYEHPDLIPKPLYPDGFMTFLVVDDCACSSIFKNGKSYFNNIVIKNRHNTNKYIPMNIIMCVQQIFNIPKTIRLNANVICLFKYGNKKTILDDLYTLVSAWCSPEEFQEYYDKATEIEHGCLVVDITKGRPIFKRGWHTNLMLKN